jgi:hypothetical protein
MPYTAPTPITTAPLLPMGGAPVLVGAEAVVADEAGSMPNITFAGKLSQPLFVLNNNQPTDVRLWSTYPAVSNIDASGFAIQNVSQVEIGSYVLTSDASGLLQPVGILTAPTFKTTDGRIFFLDASGQHLLESIDGNLYYDTELLAKASDIQDVADWALYPALQNVDMDFKTLYNVSSATLVDGSGSAVLTTDPSGGRLYVNAVPVAYVSDVSAAVALLQQDLSAAVVQLQQDISSTITTWSLYPAISNVDMSGHSITDVSSLVLQTAGAAVLTSDASGNLLVNGQVITAGGGGSAANWSFYPALNNVNVNGYDITNVGSFTASGITEQANFTNMLSIGMSAASISIHDLNPLLPMRIEGDSGIVITAPTNDVNIVAGDVNLTSTDLTSVLNITSVGPMVIASGVGLDITGGAGGLINTVGPLLIGSAAYTEVENFSFQNSALTKVGVLPDLTMDNVATVQNSGGAIGISGNTTATMTGGVAASMIATTGNATMTAQAGQANIGAATTASISATTGLTLNTTGGTASMSSNAGAISVSSGTTTNIRSGTAMDLSAGTTMALTANNGILSLTTTGANDVWVYPGTSGGLHIFSQNGNPSANPEFKIENQNGNPKGAYQKFYKNSASPANGDEGGVISFHMNNSNGVDTEFCEITTYAQNVAAGAEQGYLNIDIASPGLGLLTSATFLDGGVKPAAIYDTTATRGSSGQVLTSTGTSIAWVNPSATSLTGMTATSTGSTNPAGVQFLEDGVLYTAHIFTSGTGTFNITSNGSEANPRIDILAIGGGGAGGGGTTTNGGGGGCGNVLTLYDFPTTGRTELDPFTPVVPTPGSPFTFNISVGAGGIGVAGAVGADGADTTITCPAEVAVAWYVNGSPALSINASGGGGGGAGTGSGRSGRNGYNYYLLGSNPTLTNTLAGAGGGAGGAGANINTGNANYGWSGYRGGLYGESFVGGGFRGGSGSAVGTNSGGGGGGCRGGGYGAGTLGLSTLTCAPGGPGIELSFDGFPRYVGGGGESAASNRSAAVQTGAYFGGGFGYQATGAVLATDGGVNTGGGGGGASATTKPGDGGSGLVIIRYRA